MVYAIYYINSQTSMLYYWLEKLLLESTFQIIIVQQCFCSIIKEATISLRDDLVNLLFHMHCRFIPNKHVVHVHVLEAGDMLVDTFYVHY